MAYGLLARILDHVALQGWIAPGGIILDPFGGVGSTGILGAYKGYQVICCELEPRFVALAEQNFALHAAKWRILGCPQPVILQGDSRMLCELVAGVDIVVSSPPYEGSLQKGCPKSKWALQQACIRDGKGHASKHLAPSVGIDYGQEEGQLGAMKPGSVDAVLSSPPYSVEGLGHRGAPSEIDKDKKLHGRINNAQYGQTPGQLGVMKPGDVAAIVSSPPYGEVIQGQGAETARKRIAEGKYKGLRPDVFTSKGNIAGSTYGNGYSINSKNLGNLKYRDIAAEMISTEQGFAGGGPSANENLPGGISRAEQEWLGRNELVCNSQGETFWSAAKTIVEQCFQILRPGGYAIWVVRDFVRAKKRVDFTGDWRRLCETVGFETLHEHHALLVKEERHNTLFGGEHIKRKERKSFFRRLAESKGSPRIDYEVVLCQQKPTSP